MQKKLIYIIPIVSTLLSCSDEIADPSTQYLDGKEKSPLAISVTSPVIETATRTRAVDASFEANDVLKAYVRHVKEDSGSNPTTYSDVNTGSVSGVGPTMAALTVSTIKDGYTGIANNYDNSEASTLTAVVDDGTSTPLYWDDFSNSASTNTDLRTSGHYLQSYYGYCYNGATVDENGTTAPYLTKSTGTITGWKVETDQTKGIKKSDLLWSPTQTPVAYAHATYDGKQTHGTINIPYTHAMSKVSIEVVCSEGFAGSADDIFNQTGSLATAELIKMTTVADIVAPSPSITAVPGTSEENVKNITMRKCSTSGTASDTEKKCSFEAIIIPTKMKDGLHLATISNVDGNKYDIKLTTAILKTAPEGSSSWNSKLTEDGTTKSGVNYKLVVTIKKQEIAIVATIANWDDVNATSEGEIKFTTDISNYSYDSGYKNLVSFADASKIDLYKNTSTTFSSRSSVATYTAEVKYVEGDVLPTGKQVGDIKTPAKWTCDPVLYWQKEGDQEYFRAISPSSTETNGRAISNNTITISAGKGSDYDIMWGTTAKHSGYKIDGTTDYSYEEGAIIAPRTKEVPLIFRHKTSKVKVVLKTGTSSDPDAVDINGAKIQFTNLYTQNTLNIESGDLGDLNGVTRPKNVFAEDTTTPANDKRPTTTQPQTGGDAPTDDLFMIPQEIPVDDTSTPSVDEASYIIITLADNTVYKLKLRDCKLLKKDTDGTLVEDKDENDANKYVTEWKEGETYTYYIKLTKEKIQFFALIKDWNEVNASGDATMEWDDTIAEDIEAGAPGAGDPNAGQNEGREQGNW